MFLFPTITTPRVPGNGVKPYCRGAASNSVGAAPPPPTVRDPNRVTSYVARNITRRPLSFAEVTVAFQFGRLTMQTGNPGC